MRAGGSEGGRVATRCRKSSETDRRPTQKKERAEEGGEQSQARRRCGIPDSSVTFSERADRRLNRAHPKGVNSRRLRQAASCRKIRTTRISNLYFSEAEQFLRRDD